MILGFYVSYQKLKKSDYRNLNLLSLELASEKKLANQLNKTPKKVKNLEISINQKIIKIKVELFNINFTLKEIL